MLISDSVYYCTNNESVVKKTRRVCFAVNFVLSSDGRAHNGVHYYRRRDIAVLYNQWCQFIFF